MIPILQALLFLIGVLGTRYADSGDTCAVEACPPVAERPFAAWSGMPPERPGPVRVFARGERRPGQPGEVSGTLDGSHAVWIVGPATERLRGLRESGTRVEVRVQRAGTAR